jgi:uncharacterized membrane protein
VAKKPGDQAATGELTRLEPRWPVVLAVTTFIAMSIVLRVVVPRRESIGPHWLVPAVEIAVLLVLISADHGRLEERAQWLRPASIGLVVLLVVAALVANVTLIAELITGSEVVQSADTLLASGAVVWVGNAVAFSLLYWLLDSGGPIARYRREREFPDFGFTQHMSPELADPHWYPHYVDYFVLGVTTSTAFSPTDVMPMVPWAKLTMALQSLISLTVVGLVIARAVNVFS